MQARNSLAYAFLQSKSTSSMAEENNDNLGLDKPIKLGRVSRIPKLTDELLFDRVRGLPQVIANYPKLSRSIKKHDKKLAEKFKGGTYSKQAAHSLRVEAEVKNMGSVLQFYQLWCHGLFPRATFKDCVDMLRSYKSFKLKEYRRELISQQIHRLKVEKGLINESTDTADMDSDDDLYNPAPNNDIAAVDEAETSHKTTETTNANNDDDDEDDWGFLSVPRRSNGLFIDDEDDDVDSIPNAPKPTISSATTGDNTSNQDELPQEDFPEEDLEDYDRYEDEYNIMKEMGM
ncbi:hypothetical protein CLUG_03507 [Clavispora lusitaniae ATCC 42720]|uniref:Chromosome segregation in meiosis protein n=1 Tax=Clavispora lusitaniae (strain ATCC 42720) TaxID=306902 RepID=C4Y5S3_CLAL4|nr:uncharacterized protein CLUG_03507 [Clavispora lusitaniae ATCC 42720]EEQ39379.1 hypothetical protein CLUG_03507 [Clavispora lusitaniae ATCC 42720]